ADVGFMFIAYNLRRIVNILTKDQLIEYLRILISLFLSKTHLSRLKNSHLRTIFFGYYYGIENFRVRWYRLKSNENLWTKKGY
ncbi:MAG: hypothetical protein Q7T72_12205, partial [Bacteroidales bacterium]|nr:hypothetical protein [Bacteroidales bacterium]